MRSKFFIVALLLPLLFVAGKAQNPSWNQIKNIPTSLMKHRGAWGMGTLYLTNDTVIYNGNLYLCTNSNTSTLPTNATFWTLVGLANTSAASHSIAINQGAGFSLAGVLLGVHQTLIGTTLNPISATLPDCIDITGNHLNYSQSTDTFSCGTSGGGGGGGGGGSVTWKDDNFTGDGSTAAFTLSATPPLAAALKVYVDGQLQYLGSGNDYTLSSNVVTFTTPSVPLSGARIKATYEINVGVVGSPIDSSTLGQPNGTAPLNSLSQVPNANLPAFQAPLGFTPENVANRTTSLSPNDNSHYPTNAAVNAALAGAGGGGFSPYGTITASVPACGALTWVNQQSATCAAFNGGLLFKNPGEAFAAPEFNLLLKSAPATPWTFVVEFIFTSPIVSNTNGGIVVRDSGTGKFVTLNVGFNGGGWNLSYAYFNSATSFNTTVHQAVIDPVHYSIFLAWQDNGTTFSTFYSFDGADYIPFLAESRTNFIATPNQGGIGIYTDNQQRVSMFSNYWNGL